MQGNKAVKSQSTPTSAATMSIGAVLERLQGEFPDITVSKIRFLEAEGLISPERTVSGYRRFTLYDCERLRHVLTAQRDHYLPLKVIKEQLAAFDRGERPAVHDPAAGPGVPRYIFDVESVESESATRKQVRVSLESLMQRTGTTQEFVAELRHSNLIAPSSQGFYTDDDVAVVQVVVSLSRYGIEVRHLRAIKIAADRQADLIAQITTPHVRHLRDGKARAEDLAHELIVETERLHKILLKSSIDRALD